MREPTVPEPTTPDPPTPDPPTPPSAPDAHTREPAALTRKVVAGASLLLLVVVGAVAITQLTGTDDAPGMLTERPGVAAPTQDDADPDAPGVDPDAAPEPGASESPSLEPVVLVPRVDVVDQTVVAEGLDVPWGLAELPDGDLLVTLRDRAQILRVSDASGGGGPVALTGPGAEQLLTETVPQGEGGLLGIAVAPPDPNSEAATDTATDPDTATDADPAPAPDTVTVFVYRTGAEDNAVLRSTLTGNDLAPWEPVVTGIPRAGVHNGGALGVGPDGHLYVATGDAGDTTLAQDVESLGGKILRVALDGTVPSGNPIPGSPLWSWGHRNVQGLDWDDRERMFASEFGQNEIDELNLIVAGQNYGWPRAEGPGGTQDGFVDPVAWWSPMDASPSGLAVTSEGIYLAGLRGERLWRVPLGAVVRPEAIEPQALLVAEHGRLRGLLATDDGLLVTTSNTDGRGEPAESDDRVLRLTLASAAG